MKTADAHMQQESATASGWRVDGRLQDLGNVSQRTPKPICTFASRVVHAGVLYLSGAYGTIPSDPHDGVLPFVGKVGAELSIEDGYPIHELARNAPVAAQVTWAVRGYR